jgi:hypothetical protein
VLHRTHTSQVFLNLARENFDYEKAVKTGQGGLDKLVGAAPWMRELRAAEKEHDPIGIMDLRSVSEYFKGAWEDSIWSMHCALYVFHHYSPRVFEPEGTLEHLDGFRVIFIGGGVMDATQAGAVARYLRDGGRVVLAQGAALYSLERPDEVRQHFLLDELGVDFFSAGRQLPDVKWPHDVYPVGKGELLLMRRPLKHDHWDTAIPGIMKWAGLTGRLANSDDRYMQIHVLSRVDTWYLATTHRGTQAWTYNGPPKWAGKVYFCGNLPSAKYRVTEITAGTIVGEFSPAELAQGFDAGAYTELQMKVFRIQPLAK